MGLRDLHLQRASGRRVHEARCEGRPRSPHSSASGLDVNRILVLHDLILVNTGVESADICAACGHLLGHSGLLLSSLGGKI